MKLLLNCIIILAAFSSEASIGQLAVKGGSWSFQTENVRANSGESSGVGAYAFEVGYQFTPKFMGVFGLNILMSDIYTGSSAYGFDIGGKYFPFSLAGTLDIESGNNTLTIQEKWRPYVGLFLRQRIFNLALSASYLGPGISIGTDYAWNNRWFINGELRYDYLYGEGDALAKQMNILIGLGMEF